METQYNTSPIISVAFYSSFIFFFFFNSEYVLTTVNRRRPSAHMCARSFRGFCTTMLCKLLSEQRSRLPARLVAGKIHEGAQQIDKQQQIDKN